MAKFLLIVPLLIFYHINIHAQCSSSPTIIGDSSGCVGAFASYNTESGMTAYSWTIIGGTIMPTNNEYATVRWDTPGSGYISVNYTDLVGCRSATPTVKGITINPKPIPTISGSASVCQGSSGNIYTTEAGQTSYNWFLSNGGIITSGAGTNSIVVTWSNSGNQSIYVTYVDSNGCSTPGGPSDPNPVYKYVIVSPLTASISGNSSSCTSTIAQYQTQIDKSNYAWSMIGGGSACWKRNLLGNCTMGFGKSNQ